MTPALNKLANQIFLNEQGLRAGWRMLVYAVFSAGLGFAGEFLIQHFARPKRGSFVLSGWLIQEAFLFTVIFSAALIMARLEGRRGAEYGLPLEGAFGKRFWQGWLLGLLEISLLVGIIAAFGGYSYGALALSGAAFFRWGMQWAFFFVFVGLFEEFLFRGYTQFTLADAIGFWPAAILLSCSFGLVHLRNPGEGWVGAAGVVAIGLLFAFTLRRTGNLWLAVGWHASFDFGETFLYSVPNSGLAPRGHLSSASLHGAKWLTGGTVGPEGSVFSFLIIGALAILIHLLFPARKREPAPK